MKRNIAYILIFISAYFIFRYWRMKKQLEKQKMNPTKAKKSNNSNNVDWEAETVDFEEIKEYENEK